MSQDLDDLTRILNVEIEQTESAPKEKAMKMSDFVRKGVAHDMGIV